MGMTDKQYEVILRKDLRELDRIEEEMKNSKGESSKTLDDWRKDIQALLQRL